MTSQGASPGRCRLRGRVDRLGTLDQAGDDRADADRAETGDLPGGPGAGSRDALLRRLEQLPRGHPSAVRAGASGDRPAPARQEAAHDREAAADGRDSSRTDGPTAGCETAADGPDSRPRTSRRPAARSVVTSLPRRAPSRKRVRTDPVRLAARSLTIRTGLP